MKKLDRKHISDIFALSPMQEGIFSHYLKAPGSDRFFEQLRLTVSGTVHNRHFEDAWNVVVKNNGMLRAVFRWEGLEKPVQVILKEHRPRVEYFDFSGLPPAEREHRRETLVLEQRKAGFDPAEVPFRVTLCKTGESVFEIILSHHHILYDGWSSGIILGEFFGAYNALSSAMGAPDWG